MLSESEKYQLWNMLKPIRVGMFTTWNGDFLHARPMRHTNNHFDGTLCYLTRLGSGKIIETKRYKQVCVSYADTHAAIYLSLSGAAEISQDQALIEEFWDVHAAAWFPEGKKSEDAAIIKLHVDLAEYWDAPSSRMIRLLKQARASFTHEIPNIEEHKNK